ncbi:Polysaccharide deacetylase [compost metagenome]
MNYINGPNYPTLDQLKEIQASGLVDIQSHTLSHANLASLSILELDKELGESKKYLKDVFNIDSTVICFPYGKYNKNVLSKSKEYYTFGLAMYGGVYYSDKDDIYEISRIYANRSMTMNTFISYLNKSKVQVEW